jgi:hypothetical protein
MITVTSGDTHDVGEFTRFSSNQPPMLFPTRLSAVLFGTAALVSMVHTLPSHAALSNAQVGEIARQVTVQIDAKSWFRGDYRPSGADLLCANG